MTAPLRIIVTGTRNAFRPYPKVEQALAEAWVESRRDDGWYGTHRSQPMVVVHGANGNVDRAAERFVREWRASNPVSEEPHPADWDKHGRPAGPIRNSEMAKAGADLCLAFWDGKSDGTLDMITKAVRHGIPVRIVPIDTRRTE